VQKIKLINFKAISIQRIFSTSNLSSFRAKILQNLKTVNLKKILILIFKEKQSQSLIQIHILISKSLEIQ